MRHLEFVHLHASCLPEQVISTQIRAKKLNKCMPPTQSGKQSTKSRGAASPRGSGESTPPSKKSGEKASQLSRGNEHVSSPVTASKMGAKRVVVMVSAAHVDDAASPAFLRDAGDELNTILKAIPALEETFFSGCIVDGVTAQARVVMPPHRTRVAQCDGAHGHDRRAAYNKKA